MGGLKEILVLLLSGHEALDKSVSSSGKWAHDGANFLGQNELTGFSL